MINPFDVIESGDSAQVSSATYIAVPFLMVPERQWSLQDLRRTTGFCKNTIKHHLKVMVEEGSTAIVHDGIGPAGYFCNVRYTITYAGMAKFRIYLMYPRSRDFRNKIALIARQVNKIFLPPRTVP